MYVCVCVYTCVYVCVVCVCVCVCGVYAYVLPHDTHTHNTTHPYKWHDSWTHCAAPNSPSTTHNCIFTTHIHITQIFMTWLFHTSDLTHDFEWRDSSLRLTWLITHIDMTHESTLSLRIHQSRLVKLPSSTFVNWMRSVIRLCVCVCERQRKRKMCRDSDTLHSAAQAPRIEYSCILISHTLQMLRIKHSYSCMPEPPGVGTNTFQTNHTGWRMLQRILVGKRTP